MYPAKFEYHRPETVHDAVELLSRHGSDAKICAGGQSLLPAMKLRLARPDHLIDLGRIGSLRGIRLDTDALSIQAMTTHYQVESSFKIKEVFPALAGLAANIADPQVRNRGTIGGSLVNADPAADYPAAMLAYDAELVCLGSSGHRFVKIGDWFQAIMTTALREDEILTEIRLPFLRGRVGASYLKLPHPASRFALVGIAAVVVLGDDNRCEDIRVGVTGVGSIPSRASSMESSLRGSSLDENLIASASAQAADEIDVQGNLQITKQDHRQLCCVYAKRAVLRAWSTAASIPVKV